MPHNPRKYDSNFFTNPSSTLQQALNPPPLQKFLFLPLLPYTPRIIVMCPSCNGEVVNGTIPSNTNGQVNGQVNGQANGHGEHTPHNPQKQPFASVGDYLSNVSNFRIIESTLREGEQVIIDLASSIDLTIDHILQFANAFFDTETKVKIAKALDAFGVEYIELTSPASSEQSRKDCEIICKLGLKAKILTHVRCHMDDARIAVETGVDGLDIVIGTSPQLMQHSHGKSMDYIRETALEVNSVKWLCGLLGLLANIKQIIGHPIRQIQGLGVQILVGRLLQIGSCRSTQHLFDRF